MSERVLQLIDPDTGTPRYFQGVELTQTKLGYHRFRGNWVDGGMGEVTVVVDSKALVIAYEDELVINKAPKPEKIQLPRKPRSDKGKRHQWKEKR
jgi:hypothetical protein